MNKTCTFGIDAETFGVLSPSGVAPKERLVTVSGTPPITLQRVLPGMPESIMIYGNTVDNAGVGDKTANLYKDHNTYVPVEANIEYAILLTDASDYIRAVLYDETDNVISQRYGARNQRYFLVKPLQNGYIRIGGNSSTSWVRHPGKVNCVVNNNILRKSKNTDVSDNSIISANLIGSYTFEPYGYKIPLSVGSNAINIFSDVSLGNSDILTITPKTQTVIRGDTVISSLQDWTQNFDLPEADSVSVTVNTVIQPENISISYYSN